MTEPTRPTPSAEPPSSSAPAPPPAGEAPDDVTATRRPGRIRRTWRFLVRHRRGLGSLVVLTGAFSGGAVAGWSVRDLQEQPVPPAVIVTVDRPVSTTGARADVLAAAPNVLGLTVDEARQVLTDAGANPTSVTTQTVEAAGANGTVVSQQPPPGVPAPDGFVLSVARPAQMPDLVGEPAAAARDRLDALGARVSIITRYEPGVQEGQVLATEPAAGDTLPTDVTVVVAAPPTSLFLTSIRAIDGSCGRRSVQVDATEHEEALVCAPTEPDRVRPVVYLLDRRVAEFTATIGQSDADEPGTTVRWVVRGDGEVLAEGTSQFGQSTDVLVDVAGVLRLELEAVIVDRPEGLDRPSVVFGSPMLIGGAADIDALLAES